MIDELNEGYDVAVIGGTSGPEQRVDPLSSRRSVIVIDTGHPGNAPAGGMHGLLGHDGIPSHNSSSAGAPRFEAMAVRWTMERSYARRATRDARRTRLIVEL